MDVLDLLSKHRSIRKFKSDAIDDHLFEKIILAGQASASSSFIQACTIIRITDANKRKDLRELAGHQAYIEDAPEFLVFCADLSRSFQCCRQHYSTPVEGLTEQFIIATVDTAIVAQSTAIAAESVGLGICYIGAIRNDPFKTSELLELPEHTYPVFGMCIGYPDEEPEVKPRLPLNIFFKTNVYEDKNDEREISAYDEAMLNYYKNRTKNQKQQSWSEQMAGILSKENRPFMKKFLTSRGFLKN
ncbi:MAG: oxygen-insensitive NADPH nitroreductase [Alphaproteobacteria bacterium]|nr:oxygen-insensitive NADPH nitroreductase [Alphaproteobacteria bacterium]